MPVLNFLAVVFFVAFGSLARAESLSWEQIKDKYRVDNAIKETLKERHHLARGQLIMIDTGDQEACRKVFESVSRLPRLGMPAPSFEDLCRQDKNNPIVTLAMLQDVPEYVTPINIDPLRSTEKNLTNDTRNLAYSMGATLGILWLMPESVTKWDKDEIRNNGKGIFTEYAENVRRGPVIDKDDWAVNYIGHPLSGAAYYTLARQNGKSKWQSFGYSVVMSTFFWEYGFEAFAEVPSIQDLILTPVMGSIIGEAFYSAEASIRANDGKLLGSEKLGRTALVILNPMGAMSSSINKALGSEVVRKAEAELVLKRPDVNLPSTPPVQGAPDNSSGFLGVRLKFSY